MIVSATGQKMKRRILFYNWDPLTGSAGGGVTAYLTELISQIICDTSYEIWFLNAGRKYTADGFPRLEKRNSQFQDSVQCYEIVNSPILSPGRQSIVNIRKYLEDEIVYHLCKELIVRAGGFHIVHYHNLEGLSLKTLTLKKDFPDIKFIYSFHNYYPVCSQVNLWKDNKKNCDTTDFTKCGQCYKKENYDLALFRFQHIDIPMLKDIFLEYSDINPDKDDLDLYRKFREKNILYFNQYIDNFLAVSEKTKQVLIKCGLDEGKMQTLYAGANVARYQKTGTHAKNQDEILRIIYLGYMREDKGFYFFLDTLHDIEENAAKKISVTVVARYTEKNEAEIQELISMKQKFYDITLHNGFCDYKELREILSKQDLGIVPTLWEDNLPRTAIEQMAFGVPILSSDLGGASELGGQNSKFIFRAGDKGDFLYKLMTFVHNKGNLEEYWKNSMKLITMEDHVKALKKIYHTE